MWVQSLGLEDPLEKEMATSSSILVWKIPWTEEPCRLPTPVFLPGEFHGQRSFPVALVVKNPSANASDLRDVSLILGSGRFPGGGNGNPLQYSYLGNPKDRGAWWATVYGSAKSQTPLSD